MGADLSLQSALDRLDYNLSKKVAVLRQLNPAGVPFKVLSSMTKAFEILGSSATTVPLSILGWILLKSTSKEASVICFNLVLAQLMNIAIAGTIKSVVRRQRPDYSSNDDMYLTHGPDIYSFPSGHAVQMFLISRFILSFVGGIKLRIFGCLVCYFISFLRIFTGRHFLSDVIGGSAMGWWSFDLYCKLFWQDSSWF